MGLFEPLSAVIAAFCLLGVLIYKRVNLGITLNVAALFLGLLALDLPTILTVVLKTTTDPLTISLVVATFGIMLLSLLYKESGVINALSGSLSRMVNNSKLIVTLLPAVLGLLPVGGGALMSAPLVETETEKLGLKQDKKTYVNLWFRHTIFPVYPVSQELILAATLTGVTITALIIRQIPVVVAMVVVGYLIGLWKTKEKEEEETQAKTNHTAESKRFLVAFLPILATIVAVVVFGINVSIGAFIGVAFLLVIARPRFETFVKPFKSRAIWGITLAAYGAFLLRNVAEAIGISQVFSFLTANGSFNVLVLLVVMPAFLSAVTGSLSGGIAMGVSMLTGIVTFSAKNASLLYMSSYLGYVVAPTHLCLVLTAEYFKCPLGGLYKYLVPSVIVSFLMAIIIYLVA